MIATNIFALVVIAFQSVFGGDIWSFDLERESTTSTVDYCPLYSNMSTSFVDVPRKPGVICREKCQQYNRCTAMGKHPELMVGFKNTTGKECPHMVLVGFTHKGKKEFNCGGSLISENFVLTAAHCLSDKNYGNATWVRFGFTNIHHWKHWQDTEVSDRICHPKYKKGQNYHDIGLLRLSTIYFNDYTKPACLHLEEDSHLLEHSLVAVGWGEIGKDSGKRSENLQKIELKFYDHEVCNTYYKKRRSSKLNKGVTKENMICAGSPDSIQDPCQGDSGGPLHVHNGDTYVLIGVTSLGKPCGYAKDYPSVFTKVSYYLEWIVGHVWPETISVSTLYR